MVLLRLRFFDRSVGKLADLRLGPGRFGLSYVAVSRPGRRFCIAILFVGWQFDEQAVNLTAGQPNFRVARHPDIESRSGLRHANFSGGILKTPSNGGQRVVF
jgi:hypothetical protein